MTQGDRQQGTVKWFSDEKGFGFITPEGGDPNVEDRSKDVFVHHSEIQSEGNGRRTLGEGDKVEFEVEQGPKGLSAVKVVVLEHGQGSHTRGHAENGDHRHYGQGRRDYESRGSRGY